MPMPRKPTPERYCGFCGKRLERKREKDGDLESLLHFGKRKFCDRMCMAQAFGEREDPNPQNWTAAHAKARRLIPPGSCSKCGAPNASDVHHKDGDWTNNEPSNLERLCRSCHNSIHERRKACVICGKPQKGLGYCDKHYQRFKKYGDPLLVKPNQHTPITRLKE